MSYLVKHGLLSELTAGQCKGMYMKYAASASLHFFTLTVYTSLSHCF